MVKTTSASTLSAKKTSLAAAAAAVTKNILGGGAAAPRTIQLPQAVSEIHVSPEDVIPAGTIITDAIAEEAGLDDHDMAQLEEAGHLKLVEVFEAAAPPAQG